MYRSLAVKAIKDEALVEFGSALGQRIEKLHLYQNEEGYPCLSITLNLDVHAKILAERIEKTLKKHVATVRVRRSGQEGDILTPQVVIMGPFKQTNIFPRQLLEALDSLRKLDAQFISPKGGTSTLSTNELKQTYEAFGLPRSDYLKECLKHKPRRVDRFTQLLKQQKAQGGGLEV